MSECQKPIYYFERKKGTGKDCSLQIDKLRNKTAYEQILGTTQLGREYMANDEAFQYLETLMTKVRTDISTGIKELRKSYIYIISKNIGKEVYYKMGLSDKSNLNRISGAQTFLIPGLNDDIGFKIHMIYTFPSETIGTGENKINYYIEKMTHAVLRFYFKASNIKFGNDEPSEWYLIPENYGNYFCGFILDIIATFAYSSEDATKELKPQEIFIFTQNKKPIEEIKLPNKLQVKKRLTKDDRYNQLMNVYDNHGLRNLRVFSKVLVDVEIQETDKTNAKGSKDRFEKVLFKQGEILKKDDKIVGRKFQFKNSDYLLTKIIKNTYKYGIGQPLQSGEIYGIISKANSEEVLTRDVFEKAGISVIPYRSDDVLGGYVDFCVSIGDLLELLKPEDVDSWELKPNYEYYKFRKASKTSKTLVLKNNDLVPNWYFQKDIQEKFARKMISDSTNKSKWEHQDTSMINPSKSYTWNLTGQTILKEEFHEDSDKNKIRSAIFVLRERKQGENYVTEEVPIIRLMRLFKVKEDDISNVNRSTYSKDKIVNIGGDLKLQTNDHIRIPRGLLVRSIEDGEDETDDIIVSFLIQEIYSKTIDQTDEVFFRGIIKYPFEDEKRSVYTIHLKDLEKEHTKIKLLEKAKYPIGTVIKAIPNAVTEFGETCTDEDEFHYATIKKVQLEKDFVYDIQYFPPFDKLELWPIPVENKDEVKIGKHTNPRQNHYETWEREKIESGYFIKVNKKDKSFAMYKKKLLQFKLPVSKVLGHIPLKAKTNDEATHYTVVFDNRSKGKITKDELPESLLVPYWAKKSSTRKKRGGSTKCHTRKHHLYH